MTTFDDRINDARLQQGTFDAFLELGDLTGNNWWDIQHLAMVEWLSVGAQTLLQVPPDKMNELFEARQREDWAAVAGIIDWLQAGRNGS